MTKNPWSLSPSRSFRQRRYSFGVRFSLLSNIGWRNLSYHQIWSIHFSTETRSRECLQESISQFVWSLTTPISVRRSVLYRSMFSIRSIYSPVHFQLSRRRYSLNPRIPLQSIINSLFRWLFIHRMHRFHPIFPRRGLSWFQAQVQ